MKPELSWSERFRSHSVGWAGCEMELGRGSMLVTYRGSSRLLAFSAGSGLYVAPTGAARLS